MAFNWFGTILTVIGALNWGLIGLFNFNLVTFLFGVDTLLTRIVYILVGIAGIALIFTASATSSRREVRERD